jgi:hypothetical protein
MLDQQPRRLVRPEFGTWETNPGLKSPHLAGLSHSKNNILQNSDWLADHEYRSTLDRTRSEEPLPRSPMSAFRGKADIARTWCDVRF